VLSPAARAGTLAASAVAVVAVSLGAGPVGAAPGHPQSPPRAGCLLKPATRGAGRATILRTGRGGHDETVIGSAGPAARARSARVGRGRVLTVKATTLSGRPDSGDLVVVANVDNGNRLPDSQQQQYFSHGAAKYCVPAGHYTAVGLFVTEKGPPHYVVLPQFTVTRKTTVTMAETAATSKVTMATPRPTALRADVVTLLRTAAAGPSFGALFVQTGGGSAYFSPTHVKPTVGTLQMQASQQLQSPRGHGVPYEYTVSYADPPGIIPAQHYMVRAKDLATVHERFYQPVTSSGLFEFRGLFPFSFLGSISSMPQPLSLPGRLTEYAGGTGIARVIWKGGYAPSAAAAGAARRGGTGPSFLTESPRPLRPGEQLTDTWSAYPLHPAANVLFSAERTLQSPIQPSAVRAGNTLRLDVDPFDDSQPGHLIGLLQSTPAAPVTGSYQIDENGTKIAGGDAVTQVAPNSEFYTQAALSPKPATIRFSLDLSRTDKYFPLSTATRTVWTWHTGPAAGATVPRGWSCAPGSTSRNCAIQPMMTLGYAVAGLNLDGATKPGRQVLHLTVGHLQAATASSIAKVTESVSFDGGKTWHPATVTGGGGSYTAVFTAPAGAKVTLRTSATDAAGGSVAETITSAYQVAS
jgi:hypothetical protein